MVWSRELNAKAAEIFARENLESHATSAGASIGAGWSRELNAKGAALIEQEGPHAEAEHTASAATRWLLSWCRSLNSSRSPVAAKSTGGLAEECPGAAAVCEPGAGWSRGLNAAGMNLVNESRLVQHYDEVTRLPPGAAWSRGLNARAAEVASPVMQHYDAVTNSPPGTAWSRDLNAKALEAMVADTMQAHYDAVTNSPPGTAWSRDLNAKALETMVADTMQGHSNAIAELPLAPTWSRELNAKAAEAESTSSRDGRMGAWSRELNRKGMEMYKDQVGSTMCKHHDAITALPAGTTWSRELNMKVMSAEVANSTDAATAVSGWSKDFNSKAMESQLCTSLEKHFDAMTTAQGVTWSKDLNKKAADSEAAWSLQRHFDAITEAAAGTAWSKEMNLQAVEAWDKQTLHDSRPLRRKTTLEPKPHGRERQFSDVSTAAPLSRQATERAPSWDDDLDDDEGREWPSPLEERCAQIPEGVPELHGAQE
jgi:hypothetical protein